MRIRSISILFAITFLLFTVSDLAQRPVSAEMTAADQLFKAQKFAEAAAAYETILRSHPDDGTAWYQLAQARYALKDYPASANAFQKNIAISQSGFAMYNLACVYSLMGEKEKAIEWLTKTVGAPKMVLPVINFNDPDLSNIRDDARFKELAEKVDRTIRPCKYSEDAKQFDFWVGEWDVYNPQGRHDGTSVIQSIASGCGVLENWADNFGGTGKSINFYDSNDGKWYQFWIGANGVPGRWSGVYRDGAIRYETETIDKTGKKTLGRLTFFNIDANTVRQFAESSIDGGKTWSTNYDYKYIRKK